MRGVSNAFSKSKMNVSTCPPLSNILAQYSLDGKASDVIAEAVSKSIKAKSKTDDKTVLKKKSTPQLPSPVSNL